MTTIALSSKGQITLPIEFRRLLGLNTGDELVVTLNRESKSIVVNAPMTIDELSAKISSYIKPGTKPVLNVGEYYDAHRMETIR
jgi:AbrB family looped-hinge helix DNA binding protein